MPDGNGVQAVDGKLQDAATGKQCQVIVSLARIRADRDAKLKAAYGF